MNTNQGLQEKDFGSDPPGKNLISDFQGKILGTNYPARIHVQECKYKRTGELRYEQA